MDFKKSLGTTRLPGCLGALIAGIVNAFVLHVAAPFLNLSPLPAFVHLFFPSFVLDVVTNTVLAFLLPTCKRAHAKLEERPLGIITAVPRYKVDHCSPPGSEVESAEIIFDQFTVDLLLPVFLEVVEHINEADGGFRLVGGFQDSISHFLEVFWHLDWGRFFFLLNFRRQHGDLDKLTETVIHIVKRLRQGDFLLLAFVSIGRIEGVIQSLEKLKTLSGCPLLGEDLVQPGPVSPLTPLQVVPYLVYHFR